jgi:hypothetical protein
MRHLLVSFLIVLVLGMCLLLSANVRAAGGAISVLDQRAENQFPDGIRFFITAQSPNEISDIKVFLTVLGVTKTSTYRAVDINAGTQVSGEALVRSGSGGEYIPPGTRLQYYFEIQDKAGEVYRTDSQVLVYFRQ